MLPPPGFAYFPVVSQPCWKALAVVTSALCTLCWNVVPNRSGHCGAIRRFVGPYTAAVDGKPNDVGACDMLLVA